MFLMNLLSQRYILMLSEKTKRYETEDTRCKLHTAAFNEKA